MKNVIASAVSGAGLYFGFLRALTLQASTTVGASSFSVDLSTQSGDELVFEQGTANQETATVLSVTGSGPYTVTPTAALTKAHNSNAFISHMPKDGTTVHEMTSVSRTAANWSSPNPAGVVTSAAASVTMPSGQVLGSVGMFSASTSGTYYDSSPVLAQDYRATGAPYTPIWVSTSS